MKMYDYLVNYMFTGNGYLTPCNGTIQIYRKKKIKTFDDINELNKLISEQIDGATNLTVTGFILLGRNKH